MKNIFKYSLLLALPMLTLAACSEDEVEYSPATAEQGTKAFFLAENPSQISLLPQASTFNVTLSRTDASSALSVPVTCTASKADVFTFPAAVDFASGATQATLTVAYDGTKLDYEEAVSISIAIAADMTTQYGIPTYNATAMIPAPWASLGMGTYVDDFVTTFFGVGNQKYEVEVQANQVVPGLYRIVNPYGEVYPWNEPGDYDDTKDYYIEIHAEDPDKVYIPTTVYGTNWGYGNFIFSSIAGLRLEQGRPDDAEGYYGTLKDGIVTFPAGALLFGMSDYNNGGLYTSNGNGAFTLAMPGVVLAEYNVSAVYAGRQYDADDNLYILSDVELSADIESAIVGICPKGQENAFVSELIAGTVEGSVSVTESCTIQLPFSAENESGKYSIVAVGMAAGEAQCASSNVFNWAGNGAVTETWTPLYYGNYEYSQVFTDENDEPIVDEDLVLYESDLTPGRYKIGDWCYGVDFIFTMDDEGNVEVLEEQETGCETSYGMMLVEELATYAGDGSMGYSYYDNGVFYFNLAYYVEAGCFGYGYETFTLTAAYYEAAQRKAAARNEGNKSTFKKELNHKMMKRAADLVEVR